MPLLRRLEAAVHEAAQRRHGRVAVYEPLGHPDAFAAEANITLPWMDDILDQALACSRANKTQANMF